MFLHYINQLRHLKCDWLTIMQCRISADVSDGVMASWWGVNKTSLMGDDLSMGYKTCLVTCLYKLIFCTNGDSFVWVILHLNLLILKFRPPYPWEIVLNCIQSHPVMFGSVIYPSKSNIFRDLSLDILIRFILLKRRNYNSGHSSHPMKNNLTQIL